MINHSGISETFRHAEGDSALSHVQDTNPRMEVPMSLSREQMALTTAIENDATRNNSILYSCINSDSSQVDQQFNKFKTWVNDLAAVDCRVELSCLIIPLFCHMYLEMLQGGNRQLAPKFLKRYQHTLISENCTVGRVTEVLEELSYITCTQDINTRPIVKAFRSCKYQCQLSAKSLASLKKYLAVQGHVVLFQALQTWFDLEIPSTSTDLSRLEEDDDDKTEFTDKKDLRNDENTDKSSKEFPITEGPVDLEEGLRQLQEAVRLLEEEPITATPLLLYTIVNTDCNITCARLSQSQRVLVAGCVTSEVRVYPIPGSRSLGYECPIINNPTAHINLACDEVLPPRKIQRIGFEDSNYESLRGHSDAVHDVAFVPEANTVISVSADCTMRAWDMQDFSNAAIYRGHNYPIYSVDVSAWSVYLATASHDRTARLWSLDRTFCLRIFAGHQQEVNVVKFHPNGSYLATASADKTVRLWSIVDGKMVRVFPGHKGSVHALAFSENGKFIASAGDDKRIKVWDLAEGTVIADLKGHTDPVVGLQWIPGCDGIASFSTDTVVRTWGLNSTLGTEAYTTDILECDTGCSSLLNLQYSHRNSISCIGCL
ncbi:TAF5-like RNA polymerase II p300/CBP-associated factor-associated factor 65 kDa subunit 5L isoform X2 [Frankliniella occidentalis]|uniref:TAF5-like RNA polymerase II p300/CBP-associated factor-associated factor 65 kDa subunit 5L isoform X2 n=1 Tax=Frankliniella occidentalis TaxID=133901 RepID=A0A9C6U9P1_FRAOC|nr:TAF5-like RNA polymerase II p300/CBP-associated factor-associated factor 65 kDa subunit 5L isoform X2 [Frankliniella occidentalis]